MTGCAATWDQRGLKQAIVRGYSPRLARWRSVVNLAGPLVGVPALPPVGRPLEFVYLSHVAVDDDQDGPGEPALDESEGDERGGEPGRVQRQQP